MCGVSEETRKGVSVKSKSAGRTNPKTKNEGKPRNERTYPKIQTNKSPKNVKR